MDLVFPGLLPPLSIINYNRFMVWLNRAFFYLYSWIQQIANKVQMVRHSTVIQVHWYKTSTFTKVGSFLESQVIAEHHQSARKSVHM